MAHEFLKRDISLDFIDKASLLMNDLLKENQFIDRREEKEEENSQPALLEETVELLKRNSRL
jgi:hypothetical protein